ncbi:hypothetical protein F2Q69_00061181 [Brassica cretica]|uniref:Uncharacterized protein n=1 Tax=Brassica cretica TaxID=69181 RepID=A0A8S9RLM3_BRACR|nr:hypothetical protein F2Q69_00061181 [Brassica cretica]
MQPTYLELYNARTDVLNTRINEPLGLVTAMTFTNGMLFVGTSRGRISLWKDEEDLYTYNPQPFRYLRTFSDSHAEKITCLPSVGDNIFFGSANNIIRVWDLKTFQCNTILTLHTDTVTSLLV